MISLSQKLRVDQPGGGWGYDTRLAPSGGLQDGGRPILKHLPSSKRCRGVRLITYLFEKLVSSVFLLIPG